VNNREKADIFRNGYWSVLDLGVGANAGGGAAVADAKDARRSLGNYGLAV
jgi:hypothetical protein